ncbi:hypothetical protein G8764_11850 [Pseudomaricurvus alcaniphilus]|uniref:hypothetical protein n=1 Tax=Pseudomaricurvus alcaniphilus TaxID=1166482 RepID=UPI001409FEEF|nr:hypothetical protein [Pseudomaricurvus alcaniphilus]NHN37993.1 hypothetical protein [Pseudomaricurvus alcaniphilus]
MNELQRIHYLDAMGIDSYMPRRVLPNAPLAQLCEPVAVPVAAAGAARRPQPVAQGAAASPAPGAARPTAANDVMALLQERSTPPVTPGAGQAVNAPPGQVPSAPVTAAAAANPAAATPAPASPPVAAAKTAGPAGANREQLAAATTDTSGVAPVGVARPRFALSFWRVGSELMIIDSRHPELALPTESLLNNILFALGYTGVTLPRAEIFKWPMHENIAEARDEYAARDALGAMLAGKLELNPVKYCLLLGEEACYYALPTEVVSHSGVDPEVRPAEVFKAMVGTSVPLPELAVTAIVAPGLSQMLQQPQLKAVAWRAIQPLRLTC